MKKPASVHNLSREEIQRVAEDIYIYGYPLLLMDVMKRTHTAIPHPTLQGAPVNQFAHGRFLPGPHDKSVVHPNVDCLRSNAWLDLRKGPVVLTVPLSDRYYFLSFFSGWYDIVETHSPRNAGTQGGHFGFVAPRWRGRLPAGVKRIVSPTETVWIDGWFEVDSPEDVELVHGIQNQFRLTPLSEWGDQPMPHGMPFRVGVDHKTSPQQQLSRFDARAFYTRLSTLLQRNPPQSNDTEIVAEFIRIGFLPSPNFVFETLPVDTMRAMHEAVAAAQLRIDNAEKAAGCGKTVNNWLLQLHPGCYEKDYLGRAAAARSGVAIARAEDVLRFHTAVDRTGEPLKGSHQYVLNFGGDHTPPVNAFWSLTLYDSRQHLPPTSMHRNSIRDRDRLRLNPDNSLSVYIQHDWPGINQDSNWLVAPKDTFNLVLRMYWPKPDAVTGNWRPPAVTRTS